MNCDLIWNEYALAFNAYEAFNSHALTLKSWSVTVALAAMLSAYSQPIRHNGRIALLLAACSTLPFYWIDALWKSFQRGYLPRLKELEELSKKFDCAEGLGIIGSWQFTNGDTNLPSFLLANVMLPHLFILAAGVLLAWKFPPNPARETAPESPPGP